MTIAFKRSATAISHPLKSKKIYRQVSKETFIKWQRLHEREFQAMSWLRCSLDHSDKSLMSTLWCEICCKYERRIEGKKNFSRAWIDGSTYHKTSNATDHVSSKQHKAAMTLRKRRMLVSLLYTSYSTIACCLHNPPWILLDLN